MVLLLNLSIIPVYCLCPDAASRQVSMAPNSLDQFLSETRVIIGRARADRKEPDVIDWSAEVSLSPPSTFRLYLKSTKKAYRNPKAWYDPKSTELILEDNSGILRTLCCFTQAEVRPEDIMKINSSWGSWLSFGKCKDLSNEFQDDQNLKFNSFKFEPELASILGIGLQSRMPERTSFLNLKMPFLPYSGFNLDKGNFGLFVALGLIDPGNIVETRKISEITDNYFVGNFNTTHFYGFDSSLDDFKKVSENRRKSMLKISENSIMRDSDNMRIKDFIQKYNIDGNEWLPGSAFFRALPDKPQTSRLNLILEDALTINDRVFGGKYENGRLFSVGIIQIPGTNIYCLMAQYNDEAYPRLAFCLLNLIGLTADGKSVSWVGIPKPSKTLFELEHSKTGWRTPLLSTVLNPTDIPTPENDRREINSEPFKKVYSAPPAINGVR